ncbi:hypothetical protein DXG01_014509 [Tephrocybe rancida]|nr:hypothetical protein DXG01_014509 [Tephrocybe rancida]
MASSNSEEALCTPALVPNAQPRMCRVAHVVGMKMVYSKVVDGMDPAPEFNLQHVLTFGVECEVDADLDDEPQHMFICNYCKGCVNTWSNIAEANSTRKPSAKCAHHIRASINVLWKPGHHDLVSYEDVTGRKGLICMPCIGEAIPEVCRAYTNDEQYQGLFASRDGEDVEAGAESGSDGDDIAVDGLKPVFLPIDARRYGRMAQRL